MPSDGSIAPSARVAAFMLELRARYPDFDSLSEEECEASPWASGFEYSDQHATFNVQWSAAKKLLGELRALATEHELVLYDPQEEKVYNPPSLRTVPAWQFWRR